MLDILDLPTTPDELLVWKLEHTNAPISFKTMMFRKHKVDPFAFDIFEHAMIKWIGKLYRSCPEVISLSETTQSDTVFVRVHQIQVGAFDAIDVIDILLHADVKFKRTSGRIDDDVQI